MPELSGGQPIGLPGVVPVIILKVPPYCCLVVVAAGVVASGLVADAAGAVVTAPVAAAVVVAGFAAVVAGAVLAAVVVGAVVVADVLHPVTMAVAMRRTTRIRLSFFKLPSYIQDKSYGRLRNDHYTSLSRPFRREEMYPLIGSNLGLIPAIIFCKTIA